MSEGEWKREGFTVYSLVQDGWRRGEPVMVNAWTAHVQGSRFCEGAEIERVAALMEAAPDLFDAARLIVAFGDTVRFGEPVEVNVELVMALRAAMRALEKVEALGAEGTDAAALPGMNPNEKRS